MSLRFFFCNVSRLNVFFQLSVFDHHWKRSGKFHNNVMQHILLKRTSCLYKNISIWKTPTTRNSQYEVATRQFIKGNWNCSTLSISMKLIYHFYNFNLKLKDLPLLVLFCFCFRFLFVSRTFNLVGTVTTWHFLRIHY